MSYKIVCIEGNISAGKSTLLNKLKKHFSHRKDVVFVTEPVEDFMTFHNGEFQPFQLQERRPYLESVPLQIHIINVLLRHYLNVFTRLDRDVKLLICDRYVHAVPVFIETLYRMGYISDFAKAILLDYANNKLLKVLPRAGSIYYLDASIPTIQGRIALRGRAGECGFLTRRYLEILNEEYQRYLMTGRIPWTRYDTTEPSDRIISHFTSFVNATMSENPAFEALDLSTNDQEREVDDSLKIITSSEDIAADEIVVSSQDIMVDGEDSSTTKKRKMVDTPSEGEMKMERVMSMKPTDIPSTSHQPPRRITPVRVYPRTMQFMKLHPDAQKPFRASEGSAGYDLSCIEEVLLLPNQCKKIRTGLALNLPADTYGRISDRSSLAFKHRLVTVAGVIDEDYTGEIMICMMNMKKKLQIIPKGARIAQIIFQKYTTFGDFEEVPRFVKTTQRGMRGFGSTTTTLHC